MAKKFNLVPSEAKEWKSIQAKSKKHKIPVKRIGANVIFSKDVYTQLGTGVATEIMDARIRVKENRAKNIKNTASKTKAKPKRKATPKQLAALKKGREAMAKKRKTINVKAVPTKAKRKANNRKIAGTWANKPTKETYLEWKNNNIDQLVDDASDLGITYGDVAKFEKYCKSQYAKTQKTALSKPTSKKASGTNRKATPKQLAALKKGREALAKKKSSK